MKSYIFTQYSNHTYKKCNEFGIWCHSTDNLIYRGINKEKDDDESEYSYEADSWEQEILG